MPGIDIFIANLRDTLVVIVVAVKILSGIVSAILLYGIVWVLRNSSVIKERRQHASYYRPPQPLSEDEGEEPTKSAMQKRWEGIRERLVEGDEASYQLAIIEADKLVDSVLQQRGYAGSSMGERLKQLDSETFPRLEQLWYVHKIRNEIVHSSEYHITPGDAEEILNSYERILRDFEAL